MIQNIVLDLDQTLVSAEAVEDFNINRDMKKAIKFDFQIMPNFYIIFERPYLQEFLTYIFANYNVSVWTAATKDYADFVVKNIIIAGRPERKLDFVFHSDHCKMSRILRRKLKCLDLLWKRYHLRGYDAKNTVIIDDNSEVFRSQRRNTIRAPPFQFYDKNSEKDKFLIQLMKKL